jgi:3-oxoacyl-[acyl-carrier-protein] synthase-1
LKERVYVAGLGVISAIGHSIAETMQAFETSRSGIIARPKNFETIHELPVGEVNLPNSELEQALGIKRISVALHCLE